MKTLIKISSSFISHHNNDRLDAILEEVKLIIRQSSHLA